MKIQVTQQHIDYGVRGSTTSDPVALAMKDAGLIKPWASPSYLAWRKDNKDYYVPLPEGVLGFMKEFDNGVEVEPFTFEVEV